MSDPCQYSSYHSTCAQLVRKFTGIELTEFNPRLIKYNEAIYQFYLYLHLEEDWNEFKDNRTLNLRNTTTFVIH